ncbi:poly-beta-1,6-N-acetyl-D-glucosamine biosynthesis protein PgaD [Acinetobacter ihumii]|uniref:poly-beta-1,6-N-acetyl-D-glucosamine biosynthesis protein PgaD n=1 Tax=Acinetobacter ihumii TaxID=2483802 RepID=UPI001030436A|nr:poly-beta-1,6-N-acetyl-D-glucosamine biosynthesis protein PgaD [Acinetobacter ihumii]
MKNKQLETNSSPNPRLDIPQYIDQPEYVKNKLAGFSLQILGWTIWMWLIMPLITLFLWWTEGRNVYQQLFLSWGNNGRYSLYTLAICIGIFILMLLVWASYNWIRFYKIERRELSAPVTINEIAQSFKLSSNDIMLLQHNKNLTLYFDDHGNLIKYDVTRHEL